jgi:hypothetical protein
LVNHPARVNIFDANKTCNTIEAMITPLPNEGKTNLSILSAGVVYRF